MLLREVDEAVRQDEAAQFARKYGKIIAGIIVAGLLAFGGYLLWEENSEKTLEQGSESFVSALDQLDAGNLDKADRQLEELSKDGSPGAQAAANLLRAAIAADKHDTDKAAQMFFALADDTSAPQAYRDLAAIRGVSTNYDKMKPQQVIDRLKPLAVPGNAFFPSAAELVAMAYVQQDKKDLAGPLFAAIAKDDNAPQSLRSRARQMSGLLGFDAVEDAEATVSEDAQPSTAAETAQ
ncbi:tetratricopeptide repeat protein [Altererythrobacter salegens]|uniref:Ancillary SecYEG translocon subunit n=2 Tax=Croceibacterium salegens TaxID=1737568 RepID=A0A6I4SSN3_9SPHN|nr:tetratricopeptide repeat protein [Croceibacterium salegens]